MPNSKKFHITHHAMERMDVRGLTKEDIEYILSNGEFFRARRDRVLYSLPESPFAKLSPDSRRLRLQGTSVVVSQDDHVITVYWNDDRFPGEQGSAIRKGRQF